MTYVALLRGINVGGKNMVEMKALKACFEQAGMSDVRTYINSGNVVFSADEHPRRSLAAALEAAIASNFGLDIKVLLIEGPRLLSMADALPASWANDGEAKCDAMFLWDDVDEDHVLDGFTIKPDIDEVIHAPGVVLWRVARENATRSGLTRVVGTALYRSITVRNCNTLRKLASLVEQVDAGASQ